MFTNNRLPQYIFGDEMNQDEKPDKNTSNYSEDLHLSEPNLSRIPSPSSSLASTKKLEWDSGADIGYNYDSVKHSRKSKSYPSLNMDLSSITREQKLNTEAGTKISPTGDGKHVKSLTSIVEDDLSKLQKKKKAKSFKHSTPNDYRRAMKSCGDSVNEKATSPINIYEIKDECLQTTLVQRSSKEVQTDSLSSDKKQIEDKSLQTDFTDLLAPQLQSTSSSVSTSSKSGSFKYIRGSEFNCSPTSINVPSINDDNNVQSVSNDTTKSGVTPKSNSYSSSSKDETDSGSCSPLGQMISTQYSKNLIDDIDKSLAVLQKFIESKHYSTDTKKHYAKKIVTKIISNRYSDDSDLSSNKSIEHKFVEPQINLTENKCNNKSELIVDKKFVECGIQCDEINKKSQISSDKNECPIKESLKKLNALQTDLKNWRDAQTLSEKLFEARKTRKNRTKKSSTSSNEQSSPEIIMENKSRDYLLQHSKNERKRQLSWINNEISYLKKLKDLLQTKDHSNTTTSSTTKTNSTSTQKFHEIDDQILNLEEVERKFNEEFGVLPKDTKPQDIHKQLSKYMTNEQIKFILDHDVNKMHCNKTDCCKPTRNQHFSNTSYNSHKTSIYGEKSCKHSHKSSEKPQQTSSSELNPKISTCVDAITQCSISSKSKSENLNDLNDNKQAIHVDNNQEIKRPIQANTHVSSTDQSSSEYDDSVVKNISPQTNKKLERNTGKFNFNRGGTAYFLTFEEESMSEFEIQERKNLEQVVVKIPKYHRSSKKSKNKSATDRNEDYTLEEYLLRNRPNFVRAANWRWGQVRHLESQEKLNTIFTCHEMKEMTRRKYNKLPEIQEKVKSHKTKEERKDNRFKANTFSKKLQKKTLKGHLCLATCRSIMASE